MKVDVPFLKSWLRIKGFRSEGSLYGKGYDRIERRVFERDWFSREDLYLLVFWSVQFTAVGRPWCLTAGVWCRVSGQREIAGTANGRAES